MLAVRKIVGPPKKFKTPVFPYIPLTPEMEELNTKIIKFIKVLVEERKAQVSKVTKVSEKLIMAFSLCLSYVYICYA